MLCASYNSFCHRQFFLIRRNRILNRRTWKPIPSCPWKWPNGQGDVAKFLEGMENSESWGRAYGGCYRIWSGTSPEIVISTPEQVKTAFQDSDQHVKATNNDSGYLMSQVLGKCLGLISGNDYITLRDILAPFFAYRQSSAYLDLIQVRTDDYLERCRPHFASTPRETFSEKSRILIDPVNDFKFLPFLIVADILYGKLSPEMEAQLLAMTPTRERLFQHVIAGGTSRFHVSKWWPNTEANRLLKAFQRQWTAFNTRAYERALSQGWSSEVVVVPLFHAAQKGTITWDHCHQTLDEMLFANLDVTMGALSWNLVHLADNLDIQNQLRKELLELPTGAESKKYMQSSTTLLAACILESSRLRPLAAFTVPQAAPTDRLIDEYNIPARTNLVVDTYALNIKNEYWGADRDVYRPERFTQQARTDLRYRCWRFGFGPRQCANVGLGKEAARHFARLKASKLILAVRNIAAGEEAKDDIIRSLTTRGDSFAQRATQTLSRIDAVVENAGVAKTRFDTAEGHELSITVNVISTFLLALLLLPKLKVTASEFDVEPRLSIVSSNVHSWTDLPEHRHPGRTTFDVLDDPPPTEPAVMRRRPGLCHSALGRESGWAFATVKFLMARTTEVGSRTLVAAAAAGRESHGKYMRDSVVDDGELSAFVRSPEGDKAAEQVWTELSAILEEIQPGVTNNI
ncbi:hypothetical protein DV738_g1677, partial [Chaetothyriales sp. CBS 135597]